MVCIHLGLGTSTGGARLGIPTPVCRPTVLEPRGPRDQVPGLGELTLPHSPTHRWGRSPRSVSIDGTWLGPPVSRSYVAHYGRESRNLSTSARTRGLPAGHRSPRYTPCARAGGPCPTTCHRSADRRSYPSRVLQPARAGTRTRPCGFRGDVGQNTVVVQLARFGGPQFRCRDDRVVQAVEDRRMQRIPVAASGDGAPVDMSAQAPRLVQQVSEGCVELGVSGDRTLRCALHETHRSRRTAQQDFT